MICFHRPVISSSASSQLIGANLPSPFGADAAQRRADALRRMHELGVAIDLGAGEPGGERLLRVAAHAPHAAVLDLGEQRAHVRAVMRADDANGFH